MKPTPPAIFVEFPLPRSSIWVLVGSERERKSDPALPEYPTSDPEAEVTVTFASIPLLNVPKDVPDFPGVCWKDTKSTVPVKFPVVPPEPTIVSVNGVLEAV
jgi:hypothetical protein